MLLESQNTSKQTKIKRHWKYHKGTNTLQMLCEKENSLYRENWFKKTSMSQVLDTKYKNYLLISLSLCCRFSILYEVCRQKQNRQRHQQNVLHMCVHISPQNKNSSLHPRCIPAGHASIHVNLQTTVPLKENRNCCKMSDKGWQKKKKNQIKGIYILYNWNSFYQSLSILPNFRLH